MTKYFFIDFDNTTFSHWTHQIPASALEAFKMLQQNGHKFILASGRPFRSGSEMLTEYDLHPDCLISSNGAIVEAEGHLLQENFVDPEVQKRLIDFVLEKGYCLTTHYNGIWYCSNPERFVSHSRIKPPQPMVGGKDFLTLYDCLVNAFFLSDTPEAIEDVQAHFPELKLLRMGTELGGADVIPRANGKANGIPLILDYYGASLTDTVAIGDSMNDLEMVRTAHLGIAIGNAMPELKKAADYIAPDIDEDGLSTAIQWALSK